MSESLSPAHIWADILAVRERAPLVHSITNLVVMNFNANVLLAVGAAPVMAHAHEEVAAMAGIAQSLVLNIGTLEPYWIDSMRLALASASARGIPVVLDPVGAGATPYRNASIEALLEQAQSRRVGVAKGVTIQFPGDGQPGGHHYLERSERDPRLAGEALGSLGDDAQVHGDVDGGGRTAEGL